MNISRGAFSLVVQNLSSLDGLWDFLYFFFLEREHMCQLGVGAWAEREEEGES